MADSAAKAGVKRYSYADYLNWATEKRCELIDGSPYAMSPAPSPLHQQIVGLLTAELNSFFKSKSCVVYPVPFDVRLAKQNSSDDQIFNVVQPDISVVCDSGRIDEKGCVGAPDLIIEIVSPSTASRDHILKKTLYEAHGVKEYLLVDPVNRIVTVYVHSGNNHFGSGKIFDHNSIFESSIFAGLKIDFSGIFPALPRVVRETPPTFM